MARPRTPALGNSGPNAGRPSRCNTGRLMQLTIVTPLASPSINCRKCRIRNSSGKTPSFKSNGVFPIALRMLRTTIWLATTSWYNVPSAEHTLGHDRLASTACAPASTAHAAHFAKSAAISDIDGFCDGVATTDTISNCPAPSPARVCRTSSRHVSGAVDVTPGDCLGAIGPQAAARGLRGCVGDGAVSQ